ncbi:MAG TPA: hypothetical protein PKL58_04065, partial [Methylophilaceae bacterium]|nr:hypothetical protein [Methylophilaceae bacterium]
MNTTTRPANKALNWLLSIQSKLNHLKNLIGFNQFGDEYQQSVFRVLIISLIISSIFYQYDEVATSTKLIMGWFTVFSLAIIINIRKNPTLNRNRQLFAMFNDVAGTSISMYVTNDIGGVFVGVYLWLIIGYGFRYGKTMLMATFISSLIGFITSSLISPYWQTHMVGFYRLLITMVAIPLHALALLNRLKEATKKAE